MLCSLLQSTAGKERATEGLWRNYWKEANNHKNAMQITEQRDRVSFIMANYPTVLEENLDLASEEKKPATLLLSLTWAYSQLISKRNYHLFLPFSLLFLGFLGINLETMARFLTLFVFQKGSPPFPKASNTYPHRKRETESIFFSVFQKYLQHHRVPPTYSMQQVHTTNDFNHGNDFSLRL